MGPPARWPRRPRPLLAVGPILGSCRTEVHPLQAQTGRRLRPGYVTEAGTSGTSRTCVAQGGGGMTGCCQSPASGIPADRREPPACPPLIRCRSRSVGPSDSELAASVPAVAVVPGARTGPGAVRQFVRCGAVGHAGPSDQASPPCSLARGRKSSERGSEPAAVRIPAAAGAPQTGRVRAVVPVASADTGATRTHSDAVRASLAACVEEGGSVAAAPPLSLVGAVSASVAPTVRCCPPILLFSRRRDQGVLHPEPSAVSQRQIPPACNHAA